MINKIVRLSILPLSILLVSPIANAFQFDTGNRNLKVRWDNTLKYSNMYRVHEQDAAQLSAYNPTAAGDGDYNFDEGFTSNRLDMLTEFDVTWKRKMGMRMSADAWYDFEYFGSTDNDTGICHNQTVACTEFTDGTQKAVGKNIRLLDAFGFYKGKAGSMPYRLNVGRHAVIYGESLIGGNNAMAAANGPVDIIKAASVPGAKVKEFLLPTLQISGSLRPTSKMTLGAYYQFEWEESPFFAPGSFLSPNDVYSEYAEKLFPRNFIFGPVSHLQDITPDDSGQWGAQMRYRVDELDAEFGLYAANWHDKVTTALYSNLVAFGTSSYRRVFHEDIKAIGASASTVLGKTSVSLETSMRFNQPFVGGNGFNRTATPATNDNADNPAYAVGRSAHATLVTISVINPNWLFKDGGSFVMQYDVHKAIEATKNDGNIDPVSESTAHQVTAILTADYFNALDGLDLSFPFVFNYSTGRSRLYTGFIDGGGSIDIGVKGTYQSVWDMSLNYRNYFGVEESTSIGSAQVGNGKWAQTLWDRDFISFNIGRTF